MRAAIGGHVKCLVALLEAGILLLLASAMLYCFLGFRYSSSFLAISANRLAIRPPHQQNKGAPRFARRQPLVFAGGRIAKRFALIAKNDDE